MKFDRGIEAFIKEFVTDLANKNVAIFAGAGMSKSVGYVDWPSLLSDIAAELGLSVDKEHDLISLAQYHVNHRGNRSGITKKILEEFSHQGELSETHKILARLPIPIYWTTNYDTLIEDSLKDELKIADVKKDAKQLANTRPKRDVVVYKMHGDVHSAADAVIIKEQYEAYHQTHAGFITALSGDLVSRTFLFIGFSFTDPNLDYVLSRLNLQPGERQHYCFMKREAKSKDEDDDIFHYKQRKQELRIADLKRYKISVLLIDDYSDIVDILREIEHRFRKKTIFVSGSAEVYGKWDRNEAQKLVHRLSKGLVTSGFRVVNGFGWGVGSAVINGALEAVYEYPERYSEDQLIIRPFPQFETGEKKLADLWDEYRHRMISLAGVAIFVFGNKMGEAGEVASAGGVKREFEIAIKEGLIPIPVGATEYVARELYAMIEADPKHYYGEVDWIFPAVKELAEAEATADTLVSKMTDIIKKLNR
ncbi:SIR2 family protein [Cupriavidus basilensis]|uniref:SIR2 family protein n=1 Tax=Cupriavidus basilensis TaxID=68895 RepID=UPI0039F67948